MSKPPERQLLKFKSFEQFWPYYLSEHQHPVSRRLHFFGTLLAQVIFCVGFLKPTIWILLPIAGYLPAWLGHFVFEKNRPATFIHPLWSLRADFKMFYLDAGWSKIKKEP